MDLADALESRAAELAYGALAEMYRDPFWEARFGERGRRFSGEDGLYHVRYLVEALRAGSPETLIRYARWLQSVLTTRGMCTRHLAENFERLADTIRASVSGAADAEPALSYLASATQALQYPEGPARAVQDAAEAIAARVEAQAQAGAAATAASVANVANVANVAGERAGGAGHVADPRTVLSYLADAIALGRPEVFVDHLAWSAGFLEQRGVSREELGQRLSDVRGALEILPAAARDEALGLVEAALVRIRERAS